MAGSSGFEKPIMPAPISIRYFKCINGGAGTVIYPQLRDAEHEDVLWDSQETRGFKDLIAVGSETIVDLETVLVPRHVLFYLSANPACGDDAYETEQAFVFDPNSNLMATGRRVGTVDDGVFEYLGTKPYSPSVGGKHHKIAHSTLQVAAAIGEIIQRSCRCSEEDSAADFGIGDTEYAGTTSWPESAQDIIVAVLALFAYMLDGRGFKVTYTRTVTTATFNFRDKQYCGYEPDTVKKIWTEFVAEKQAEFPQAKLRDEGLVS